ncbi:MAG: DNA polymerase III subunit delta [Gammaproteobacteria bacterium]|nr:DNA polymerase III subunit delta [Gammaproteobacteria bacterium]
MQLRPDQLDAQSQRGLPPVVLIAGEEPLQVGEAADLVRERAKAMGCAERVVMDAGPKFEWLRLRQEAQAMSLFVQRRLIELRLAEAKVGKDGSDAISAYVSAAPPETYLLIVCEGRLDNKTKVSKWCKAIDQAGWLVAVWPIETARLPQWVSERMSREGLRASRDACALLAERMEGNLLACAQEIRKLALLKPNGVVEADDILELVADSARYDIFVYSDAALAGDLARVPRVLHGLRQEGVPETLVLWALQREIRTLLGMRRAMRQGASVDQVIQGARIWPKTRANNVRKGLMRHDERAWYGFLRTAGEVDRTIKGMADGIAWDKLLQLGTAIAGFAPRMND